MENVLQAGKPGRHSVRPFRVRIVRLRSTQ
jgi:hypothetical protein